MTIFFLNDTMGTGGKERRLLELIKFLVPEHKIILLSLSDDVGYDYIYHLPIEFIIVPRKSKLTLSPIKIIDDIIKKHNPDIIHSWGSLATMYLIPCAIRRRRSFINGFIADAPRNINFRDKYYLRGRLSFPFSKLIISNSKAGIKSYRAPVSKSLCVYNGMDFKRFENLKDPVALKTEILGPNFQGLFVIGMVANFEPRKDFKSLVAAAIKLLQDIDRLRFLLIGSGSMLEEIREMVPAGLSDKIIFLGKRSDIESIVQLFDVGVMLTNSDVHGEGISNSIIEYMALKKPVIATRGGGTDELITDGENGFLIDAASPEQLTDRIQLLLDDKNLAGAVAKKAYDLVFSEFNITVMTARYLDIYKKFIGETEK
ncbi:MAG: glycosyltransferase family 4 protein [Bacteroidetes bacterium]|nr:glycosyltransferase family 4 protein [Bacteroidota bacterium]